MAQGRKDRGFGALWIFWRFLFWNEKNTIAKLNTYKSISKKAF